MDIINSKEYWENRFSTDWKEYDGNEQTKFFASLLEKMMPEWLLHEVNENKYAVCDLGCAEGDALPFYKNCFVMSDIYGEDFSEKAIEIATRNYPEFDFKVSDILKPDLEEKYPVIICSNVVEHFKDTYNTISCICRRSTKYTLILIPYREKFGVISEHEKNFFTTDIPMQVEGNHLVYAKSISCDSIYYPYEQLLLIYAKGKKFSLLSEIVENIDSNKDLMKDQKIAEYEKEIEEKNNQIAEYEKEVEEKNNQITECGKKIREKSKQIVNYKKEIEEKNKLQTNKINVLNQEIDGLKQDLSMTMAVLRQKDEYMEQAELLCNQFVEGKLMKLNHLKNRIIGQLLKGNKEERKDFWTWFVGRIKKTNRTIGAGTRYNPWILTREKIREGRICTPELIGSLIQGGDVNSSNCEVDTVGADDILLSDGIKKLLQDDYIKYDVIILSVIDYNFRHQRPQHFATRFAANGHRVFYINANFIRPDSITSIQEKLYVADFSSKEHNAIYSMNGQDTLEWMQEKFEQLIFSHAIRDAVVVVDYPNWVYGAEFLRKKYGFKMVTDYMDDYTGFLGTAEDFLKNNCIRLLQNSDGIVASSQFLYEVASKYVEENKITIVRNGTEVEHFYQAGQMKNLQKERKVIGYYGAVAHWFDWKKVCYLAKTCPEYDIVIVGEVTAHRKELEKYSNIKLLGEKSYTELPEYLADYDVCLIPFDTSTDLIKATNPVKFYEYLSAGKKVVATEIPELMPYKDDYVYMSNDNEQFVQYVKLCAEGRDSLKSKEECVAFAGENDWQKRYECFEQACAEHVPMISIVVLTYNNLELNKKCIQSILKKTAYANYELIIVDNQSTDGTIEYLKEVEQKYIPNVKIIFNHENLGFAGGNNIGIQASKGEYVLLLNNDTVVTRGWLTALSKHLMGNPKYGMCNPVTNSIGNESQINVKYHNEKEMDEFAYMFTAKNMNCEYKKVDRLPLFSTLIKKEVVEKVGMLDDSYKIGMFEDDDYTEAVKKSGYEIVIADDAFVHHVNNASFKKLDDAEYRRIFEQNKVIFEKKWNKKWTMPHYRSGVYADSNEGMTI